MPTDIATPVWQCDVCLTSHGESRELAEICESAGVPLVLPEGTPLLTAPHGRLELIPLRPTGVTLTDVHLRAQEAGHHTQYAEFGASRVSSKELHPHAAGKLQIQTRASGSPSARLRNLGQKETQPLKEPWVAQLLDVLGLGAEGSPSRSNQRPQRLVSWETSSHWVRPITPEVRAVFDELGVFIERPRFHASFHADSIRVNYVLHTVGGRAHRANAILASTAPEVIDAAIIDLQDRWFAGEQVSAPTPHLAARSALTASKIPKQLRPVIEATGVTWTARTNASEYARTLIRNTLMETLRADARPFGNIPVIAFGGVKGGTGKSTVAAAFARRAAASGKRVILIDLDLDDPTLPVIFNLPDSIAVSDDHTALIPHPVTPSLGVISHGQIPSGILPLRWSTSASHEWLRFLAETLDTGGTDLIVLDLPAGQGPVVSAVLGGWGEYSNTVSTLIAVGSADPFTLPALDASLAKQMHERRALIVVENLGRVTGKTAGGVTVEIRPHGSSAPVEHIAARHGAVFAGSLPYANSAEELSRTDELGTLVELAHSSIAETTGRA